MLPDIDPSLPTAVFRVDSSVDIGLGHAYRCSVLSNSLLDKGYQVIFVSHDLNGCTRLPTSKLFSHIFLPPTPTTNDLYGSRLSLSDSYQHLDARLFLSALPASLNVHLFILDSYSLDLPWESYVLQHFKSQIAPKLLVIEDLLTRDHKCDFLLNQNYINPKESYEAYRSLSSTTELLLGPKYALLSPDYRDLRAKTWPRHALNRVLISFGGSDNLNLTPNILRALNSPSLAGLTVDVVIGPQYLNSDEINNIASSLPNASLHYSPQTLANLLSTADLAIGASGSSVYERMCLYVPSICFITAPNQADVAYTLRNDNLISLIEPSMYTLKNLPTIVRHYVHRYMSPEFLFRSSRSLSHICDGNGSGRIMSKVFSW